MKTIVLLLSLTLSMLICKAQVNKFITDLTPGNLITSLTTEELNTITFLAISGSMDSRDFKTIRDKMPKLEELELTNATIAAYTGLQGTSLVVGEPVQDITYPVNAIPIAAFFEKKNLKNVTLPASVTMIMVDAFSYCENLVSVNIPSSVTTIHMRAFMDCKSLRSVSISASVDDIGLLAFSRCSANISVDEKNTRYSAIDGVLFSKDQKLLISCPTSKAGNYTIPDSVVRLEDYAFLGCELLTLVNIPQSVTSIGDLAFSECRGLLSAIIPSSITTIGIRTFMYCSKLTTVNIPSSVLTIKPGAFLYCENLKTIDIPSSVTSIGENAFEDCIHLKSISVHSISPVELPSANVFEKVDKSACILYVPAESVELYKSAPGWKDFLKIEPIPAKLVVENKMWSIGEVGTMVGSTYKSYYVRFKGDTIYNGKVYKKILKSFDESHSKWVLDGFIREDPATQKVFTYGKRFDGKEELLYDFSLETGDSVLMHEEYFTVDKIVYASYGKSNEIRKHIYFKHYGYYALWIEGIGNAQNGVLQQLGFFTGADMDLACYFENDQLIYHNPHFSNCFPVGTWEENQQPKFAPIGAEWHYNFGEGFMNQDVGYYILKSSKDTVVDFKQCKVLTHTLVSSKGIATSIGQSIVYHDPIENKIYSYQYGSFNLLYDFTKQAGDTLIIKTPRSATSYDSIKLVVDSVGTIKFADNIQRKFLYVHTVGASGYIFSGKIIEGIGNENFFYPVYELYCDGGCPNPLRCYNYQTIHLNFSGQACDFTYTNAHIVEKIDVTVYPNPFTSSFTIRNANPNQHILSIEIVNQLGQSIYCNTMNGAIDCHVDLGHYPSGIYYLLINDENKIASYKLIKR